MDKTTFLTNLRFGSKVAGAQKERRISMASRRYDIDMTSGPLVGKILKFTLPVMAAGVLQLLFNAADLVVVGRFAGNTALAAVGSTGAITNLIVNLFIGLSVGTNVIVAQHYGAQRHQDIHETVHTSIAVSFLGGIILTVLGLILAYPLLRLMDTPEDVIDKSVLYMRIYFCGMIAMMPFNFGSAILRATGDTRHPLYYLTIAGVLNFLLNLFFVIVLHMDVDGVALATIISQAVSAFLILRYLTKLHGSCHLYWKQLRIYKDKLWAITRTGLPAGIQGCLFSLSNAIIQSSVNSFGGTVMAANTAASNVGGFVYTSINSFSQSALCFAGQNLGAKKYSRLNRVLIINLALATVIGAILGGLLYLFRAQALNIYTSDAEVIAAGSIRLLYVGLVYFICGWMDVFSGQIRGMGYSLLPTIVSLIGACGLRIVWIYAIFPHFHTLHGLYISYPISWLITTLAHFIVYLWIRRKLPKADEAV